MLSYLKKDVPLTISMWDYSWLLCGHPGGAFHDLARRVEEAAQRGYNTLRVDVFPHHYLKSEYCFPATPAKRVHTWGDVRMPGGYTVDVRAKVRELSDLCRQHHIWLGLDTWQSFNILGHDPIPAAQTESICRAWADAWVQALPAMRDDGVLERAVWVAPLNEVPLFLGTMLESVRVSDPEVRHEGQTHFRADLPELDAHFREINLWLGEAIHDAIRPDGIPLSYSSLGAENYHLRIPPIYDVVDVHFMPDMLLDDPDIVALEKAGEGASKFSMHSRQSHFDLALFSAAWNRACSKNYGRMLALARDYAENVMRRLDLPGGKRLQAVVTEAYGPCNHPDHPEVDWTWYARWNTDCAKLWAAYPFSGLTISNHAEPIFSFWEEAELQRTTNLFIHHS